METSKAIKRNSFVLFKRSFFLEIEGIRIGQLSHSEPYLSKKESEDGENKHDDDHYILRKLFEKSGKLV